ncbi:MAG: tRNA pseudouridine(13) synthase TruD [Candidatus Nanoarchaeia archaeon]|nr:tRNA pseudouridine(13) synthase TruD [Candidatus Haiyanarchaeum thermophilum]MCW1303430.1 tRNA pseudouridine(13) synthase TruD [Candidatus Haiyanarchaeum thermophilum]MCW1303884.1 tRNA pseudouridine(13) synthase TruD [Candidatus Haiyanarchaeum thermophilum]MCW1306869.1 tRNA pseudouridine(13) synthase TruD [Candidatus Haiyanarchaeum thermophilum]MCW1307588.1 tRNA pseudouridine(13) synthase TruD [Candidatus Haiyanarchaeum thermophilum]
MNPEIGIQYFYTSSKPIGGVIKERPEDFIVEEIDRHLRLHRIGYSPIEKFLDLLPKRRKTYLHVTLVKRNYDTLRAIRMISKQLGISRKRIGYAGNKDKFALTSQRISIYQATISQVRQVRLKEILLKNFSYADDPIRIGELYGNRFTIRISQIFLEPEVVKARIEEFLREARMGLPNFFGIQRFGEQRAINHLVGKKILLGDFEGAVKILLTSTSELEGEENREARLFLAQNWGDWKEAIKRFPKELHIERLVVEHLIRSRNDFIGALRRIPKQIRLMFINAYQSYIFNLTLSEMIRRGFRENVSVPLVGFNTKLEGEIGEIVEEILRREKITLENFKVESMPEMSFSGSSRDYLFFPEKFKIIKVKKGEAVIQFVLRKACYATTLLNELMKNI